MAGRYVNLVPEIGVEYYAETACLLRFVFLNPDIVLIFVLTTAYEAPCEVPTKTQRKP